MAKRREQAPDPDTGKPKQLRKRLRKAEDQLADAQAKRDRAQARVEALSIIADEIRAQLAEVEKAAVVPVAAKSAAQGNAKPAGGAAARPAAARSPRARSPRASSTTVLSAADPADGVIDTVPSSSPASARRRPSTAAKSAGTPGSQPHRTGGSRGTKSTPPPGRRRTSRPPAS